MHTPPTGRSPTSPNDYTPQGARGRIQQRAPADPNAGQRDFAPYGRGRPGPSVSAHTSHVPAHGWLPTPSRPCSAAARAADLQIRKRHQPPNDQQPTVSGSTPTGGTGPPSGSRQRLASSPACCSSESSCLSSDQSARRDAANAARVLTWPAGGLQASSEYQTVHPTLGPVRFEPGGGLGEIDGARSL